MTCLRLARRMPGLQTRLSAARRPEWRRQSAQTGLGCLALRAYPALAAAAFAAASDSDATENAELGLLWAVLRLSGHALEPSVNK